MAYSEERDTLVGHDQWFVVKNLTGHLLSVPFIFLQEALSTWAAGEDNVDTEKKGRSCSQSSCQKKIQGRIGTDPSRHDYLLDTTILYHQHVEGVVVYWRGCHVPQSFTPTGSLTLPSSHGSSWWTLSIKEMLSIISFHRMMGLPCRVKDGWNVVTPMAQQVRLFFYFFLGPVEPHGGHSLTRPARRLFPIFFFWSGRSCQELAGPCWRHTHASIKPIHIQTQQVLSIGSWMCIRFIRSVWFHPSLPVTIFLINKSLMLSGGFYSSFSHTEPPSTSTICWW